MSATTQDQFSTQMVAQLRALDPALSAEVGTPERKIIDTVAQVLSDNQIDISVLNGALDIDSKFGASLDSFLAVMGFGRQKATYATGFVTFSRLTASNSDIPIPSGTQLLAPASGVNFVTNFRVILTAGQTSVVVPVQAVQPGAQGNLGANTITLMVNQPVNGITTVTNENPTTNGLSSEDDDEFKTRFKNTVFRNMAGTTDMYLALAVATAFTTKANVVGPLSRYREYMQIPDVDDASQDPSSGIKGNGYAGEYTTALSTIPYSKYIYDQVPYYVTNGESGVLTLFFRQDTDFVLNTDATIKDAGDAYRQRIEGSGVNANTVPFQPNITFFNVFTGTDGDVTAARPGDIVLFEHSYMSTKSRNDPQRNINNCVDVYIDGGNQITSTSVITAPRITNAFVNNATHRLHYNNFRRYNEPERRPVVGNLLSTLYAQPVTDIPEELLVGNTLYTRGVHYWLVEDVSPIGRSVRARNGIEWSSGINGLSQGDQVTGPFTGPKIAVNPDSVEVAGYLFDQNLVDLQGSLEGSKQTTTDVLAHTSKTRYFKLDVTVMYQRGKSASDSDTQAGDALQRYFESNYYGSAIQLSDLLAVIHETQGVDNVRWSQDLLQTRNRVVECDVNGAPLLNVLVDQITQGTITDTEVQRVYLTGGPAAGTFMLGYDDVWTAAIAYNADAVAVTSALSMASIPANVTGSGTHSDPFIATFTAPGLRPLLQSDVDFTSGNYIFNSDFFLQDDELASLPIGALVTDTVPGLRIRPRAQNTWAQL